MCIRDRITGGQSTFPLNFQSPNALQGYPNIGTINIGSNSQATYTTSPGGGFGQEIEVRLTGVSTTLGAFQAGTSAQNWYIAGPNTCS